MFDATKPVGLLPSQLRTILLKRKEFFVRTVTSRLLSHALGRRIEAVDRPAIDQIVASIRDHDYRFVDLITAVVGVIQIRVTATDPSLQVISDVFQVSVFFSVPTTPHVESIVLNDRLSVRS